MSDQITDAFGYCPRHGIPATEAGCVGCRTGAPAVDPARRLNVGCGAWPLRYWTNLDADKRLHADLHRRVPPLPFEAETLDDIYAGHFLEHLTDVDATRFLEECWRCLVPGGRLGIVVPDTREILTRWLRGDATLVQYPAGVWHPVADLDAVCRLFLYSTVQDSPHLWSYDLGTLRRRLEASGFTVTTEIDRHMDPRIPVGAWYQCGWNAGKP